MEYLLNSIGSLLIYCGCVMVTRGLYMWAYNNGYADAKLERIQTYGDTKEECE